MPHDVFISYSSIDKTSADAACATFEKHGIRCWIAPRDVPAGSEWAEAIIDAIETAKVMVLIFSTHSNESRQVKREIELAVSRGLTIMPIRLEKIAPTKSMAYYMAGVHWLDALTPPLEAHFRQMVDWITPHVGGSTRTAQPPPKPKPPPSAKPAAPGISFEEASKLVDRYQELLGAGKRPEAETVQRQLIARIGEPTDTGLMQRLALTLHSLAINLERMGRYKDAVVAFDEVVSRFQNATDPALRERVATVLVDRGNPLNELGRKKEALASYDQLLAQFGTSTEPAIVSLLARGGICRGIVLDESGQTKEAIAAYEAVVHKYGHSTNARLLELVAIALYNRAVILAHLGRKRDAIAGAEEIVRRFASSSDAKLQHQVKLTRDYLAKLR